MTDHDNASEATAPAAMSAMQAELEAGIAPDSLADATPAAGRGLAGTTAAEAGALSTLQGSTAEKIDQLHREMFAGSALGHHTELWNLVASFKERVKALVAAEA